MNTNVFEARKYIAIARQALQRGDKQAARQWGEQAALLAADMEDAWLILTASDPNPQQALTYARKALKINPTSTRARRGFEWALTRVKKDRAGNVLLKETARMNVASGHKDVATSLPKRVSPGISSTATLKIHQRNWLFLLIGVGFLLVGMVTFFAWAHPVFASIVSRASTPVSTQENLWALVEIAKPTIPPIDDSALAPPSEQSVATTFTPTATPALALAEVPTLTAIATETPGTMVMEIVSDSSVGQSERPSAVQQQYPAEGNGERWIDVNLSEQRVYAYEGDVIVNSFLVSTGVATTPTVTGEYKIYVKVRIQDMSGPGYYLPDVPWVMYFYEDYGFHGTYWHNNFGTPMSRGCVNMTIDDAAWLYNWASVGTVVNVHY